MLAVLMILLQAISSFGADGVSTPKASFGADGVSTPKVRPIAQ